MNIDYTFRISDGITILVTAGGPLYAAFKFRLCVDLMVEKIKQLDKGQESTNKRVDGHDIQIADARERLVAVEVTIDRRS